MGNQLIAIAPSQIYPVEHYLTEHADLQFDVNLGSTRFFKVARAKSAEGLIVVKVFAVNDLTLPLVMYRQQLEDIRNKLQNAVNCLPFQKVVLSDKAGFIMREYVKSSLYDRISTRPFLTMIEKKWIAFQVLYALHQCHKVGVCHGDIKLENIMITSWNWVLLTDFASFKPTYLPEDNPADFSYFFDTSRRRTCYIAPERFIKTLNSEVSGHMFLLPDEFLKKGDLTPAMDIFSAGCALLELFNEGRAPFDFSELLAYRNGESDSQSISRHLEKVEDPGIRALLKSMLQRSPSERLSAEIYLDQQRGVAFPEYFYSFLQSYMLMFSSHPIVSADQKIERLLQSDIKNVIEIFKDKPKLIINGKKENLDGEETNDMEDKDVKSEEEMEEKEKETEEEKDIESAVSPTDGLVILTGLVTSCIRGLHHCSSKLKSLDILLELSAHTTSDTILDRILPYIFHLVHDFFPRVRVRAIETLTKCLALVKTVSYSDANIFPEYVLPGLASVTHDESVIVRAAYAENIAELAGTALRFLEKSQEYMLSQGEGPRPNYETELQTLHEMIQQAVALLLTDPQNLVKQTLMENGITKLCVFFGKQKANDVLLSHMITFLNDKKDKELRGSFFECIVGVAAYIGWHSSPILTPLLQQGLTDPEEFVMTKAINAMTALAELGLLQKSALYELLSETACFLVHPNIWVHQAIAGFISAMARTLNVVDVQCKVMSLIGPYLRCPIMQADKEVILLGALVPPVPRIVYNSVIRCQEIDLLLETLEERRKARSLVLAGHIPQNLEEPASLKNLFRRLISEGMTDQVEDHLLAMGPHLRKIHRHRNSVDCQVGEEQKPIGKIDLKELRSIPQAHSYPLSASSTGKPDLVGSGSSRSPPGGSLGGSLVSDAYATQLSQDPDHSLHERSFIQYRCAPCRLELRKLLLRKQEVYSNAVRGHEWPDSVAWETPIPPSGWKLRSSLVAHLHEHKGAINKLVNIPETALFASCSADGSIKIWDCAKMEGRNIANRSRQMYSQQGGPLVGLTVCDSNQSLAAATVKGSIFILRIEANSNKMSVVQSRQLDFQEDGCAVDVNYFDSGSQSVVVYATMYGSIVGWDLRSPGTAWKLENDLKNGIITSFCLDSRQCWLTLGTSSGCHICWDLRFQLPITSIVHPRGTRVRTLIRHPTESSWVLSAVHGNNEVSMWNLETQFRQCVLWASRAPPLSHAQKDGHSVCAMYGGTVDHSPFMFAGGSDMRIRFWDLYSPTDSYFAVPAANDTQTPATVSYKSRLIDGTNVVHEIYSRTCHAGVGTSREEPPRPGPEQPQPGHHDTISALSMCQASQCFLLSGSRDGVIKVWK